MNAEFEKYHLIDRYFRGELSPAEQEAFEKRLQGDVVFAEEVENQANVNELITAASFHDLRKQMSKDLESIEKHESIKKWIGGTFIFVALAFLSGYLIFGENNSSEFSEVVKHKETKQEVEIQKNKKVDTIRSINPSTQKEESNNPNSNSFVAPQDNSEVLHDTTEAVIADTNSAITEKSEIKIANKDSVKEKYPVLLPKNQNPTPGEEAKRQTTPIDQREQVNICDTVKLKADWQIEKACLNKGNGSIQLSEYSVTGGKEPYTLALYKKNNEFTESSFHNLYSGDYTLKATDNNGCTTKWNVYVGEKQCVEKDVSISPAHGETWEFNGGEGESYYLSILNRSGQVIYKSPITTGKTNWNGITNSGALVEAGLYIYIVEYTNGKRLNGQITIMR